MIYVFVGWWILVGFCFVFVGGLGSFVFYIFCLVFEIIGNFVGSGGFSILVGSCFLALGFDFG